jgi:hypothetical protein
MVAISSGIMPGGLNEGNISRVSHGSASTLADVAPPVADFRIFQPDRVDW